MSLLSVHTSASKLMRSCLFYQALLPTPAQKIGKFTKVPTFEKSILYLLVHKTAIIANP